MPNTLRERLQRSIADSERQLADADALIATLDRLVEDGAVSEQTARAVANALPAQLAGARYVLRNLGAHLAIGIVFAFDVVPLPLGTVARVAWVGGNRVVETLRGDRSRARVHSLGVFVLAAIPWFGYAAYLLPLRRESAELAFVLANRSWLARSDRTYEAFLAEARAPVRRLGRWLVPLPSARAGGANA